ncbi:MAG: AfsR/SARP family transcriptional regulator, partial [Gemmatimonadota bacterium]
MRGRNLALLALLARAGAAGMTRERLAAYLWPESDAARARHSLDQALYTIRRALDTDPFVASAGTLMLDDAAVECDVAAFERALSAGDRARALERYGGAFLEGFHLSGAPEFERWVDAERATLRARYTATLEDLAREAAADGDAARAVAYW